MGITSKRKGRRGEQELARLLADELGSTVTRNLMQSRDGGHDLFGLDGWSIEVKRAAQPRLTEWWIQALAQAQQQGAKPCLAYRLDRQQWKFIVSLRDVVPSLTGLPPHLIAELGLAEFVLLVRERIC